MRPGSIAVIGASSRPGTVGHEIVHSLLEAGFGGAIYPVNPKGDAVEGLTALPIGRRGSGCHRSRHRRHRRGQGCGARARLRGQGCSRAGRDQWRLRRSRRRRRATPARVDERSSTARHEDHRAELRRHRQHRSVGSPRCDVRRRDGHTRSDRARLAIGSGRHRGAERGDACGHGHLELRLARQQGRRERQRLPAVLGGRRAHEGGAPLSRVVRQPHQVRSAHSADRTDQADHRGQERPHRRRPQGGQLTHRGDGRQRRRRRSAAPRTAASCGSTRSTTSSTRPWCSRISPFLRVDGLPSSATRAVRGSWAQTPVRART